MRRSEAAGALASLARMGRQYGPGLGARKLALLQYLSRATLASARQVLRLHELLCFLDAYPDDRRVRGLTRRMLAGFRRRADLRRYRDELAGSGIAGTAITYRFFWPTARWISDRWPGALMIDREDPEHARAILDALPSLLEPVQAEFLRRQDAPTLAVLDSLTPRGMTDADFLVSLVAAMPGDDYAREAFFDRLDPPFILRPGKDTPERTTARFDRLPVHFRGDALGRARPLLTVEARRKPRRVVSLGRREAASLIQLARVSMATRERDLAVFQFANPKDAFLVDDGHGLAFALVGTQPHRRAVLPAIYGGLTLQNGVPIGYVQVDLLGRHAELSFNAFDTFRGADAAHVFARLVSTVHHVFDCASFSIEPYQLGDGNDEGIESGAWWFYHRMGFRPHAADTRRLGARELRRAARNRRYRSSPRTLRALAKSHLYYSLDPGWRAALPRVLSLLESGVRELSRFPHEKASDRRTAADALAKRRLGANRSYRPGANTRPMFIQWAPLVLALTSRGRWSPAEKKQLSRLIEAKAGKCEREFLRQLLRHRRLRQVLDC